MPAEKKIPIGILLIFTLITLFVSIINPVFEAPDEMEHQRAVWHIITNRGLITADMADMRGISQEDLQAPLYYLITAGATWFIDQSDFQQIVYNNPHAQIGHANDADNINFLIHTNAETWPWRGTVLALHIARFINVIYGALTLIVVWKSAVLLWPESVTKQQLALAFTAFNPMFIFISSASNNDIITSLLTTTGFYLCLITLKEGLSCQWAIRMGIVAGLAALAKVSGLTVLLIAGLTIGYTILKDRSRHPVRTGLAVLGVTFVLAGWWYIRNLILYGDPTALNAHLLALGGSREVTSLADLNRDWEGLFKSYWGVFGMFTLPMSRWVYRVFGFLTAIGLAFSLLATVKGLRRKDFSGTGLVSSWLLFLLLFAELISWTSRIGASQGRLLFPAIAGISLLLSAGWGEMVEGKARVAVHALTGLMAIHAVVFPFLTILPAFSEPGAAILPEDTLAIDFFEPGVGDPCLRLHSFGLDSDALTAGMPVTVTLTWEVLNPIARDWSLFIHAIDSQGVLIGQKDSFPAGGRLVTSELPVGRTWQETYEVMIAESAYSPENAIISVGFYDTKTCPTCERMPVISPAGGQTAADLVTLPVASVDGESELGFNPLTLTYENGMVMTGYSLSSRTVTNGEDVNVMISLANVPGTKPLKASLQVIGGDFIVAGQYDGDLTGGAEGDCSTSCVNHYTLTIDASATGGVYDLWLVIYTVGDEGSINQLTSVSNVRNYPMDHHVLTQIIIGED